MTVSPSAWKRLSPTAKATLFAAAAATALAVPAIILPAEFGQRFVAGICTEPTLNWAYLAYPLTLIAGCFAFGGVAGILVLIQDGIRSYRRDGWRPVDRGVVLSIVACAWTVAAMALDHLAANGLANLPLFGCWAF